MNIGIMCDGSHTTYYSPCLEYSERLRQPERQYNNNNNNNNNIDLGERVELRSRRVGELSVCASPGTERRRADLARLSSPLLQRRHTPGYSPASQRRSLEVASPQVPSIFSTNSLQRRRLQQSSAAALHHPHHHLYSPQLNRRSQGPLDQRRLTLDRSTAVLVSLDKAILQIR